MAMPVEMALQLWGQKKLAEHHPEAAAFPLEGVTVRFDFDEGFACCGGTDPDCYCSFAESPRADVVIESGFYIYRIPAEDFDFVAVLTEIVETAVQATIADQDDEEWHPAAFEDLPDD